MKKKLLRLTAVSVMALSFTTGIAAANSGSIDGSGRDSTNKVKSSDRTEREVHNNTNLNVKNNNPQDAHTGDARVHHNETGGDATSGQADNDGLVRGTATVNNTSATSAAMGASAAAEHTGTVSNTGQGSHNHVSSRTSNSVHVHNNSNLNVVNNNAQSATSGNATVSNNTEGGNAQSGNASNISTTEITFEVTN